MNKVPFYNMVCGACIYICIYGGTQDESASCVQIFEYYIDISIVTFLLQSDIIICKNLLFGNLLLLVSWPIIWSKLLNISSAS